MDNFTKQLKRVHPLCLKSCIHLLFIVSFQNNYGLNYFKLKLFHRNLRHHSFWCVFHQLLALAKISFEHWLLNVRNCYIGYSKLINQLSFKLRHTVLFFLYTYFKQVQFHSLLVQFAFKVALDFEQF